jgi:WD40 repeat protein
MSLEFDHFIGINTINQGALFHPDGQKYIFSSGASVVIGDLLDPHLQHFLRKHDDVITSIALSPKGRFIASGQRGENTDVMVWDYERRELLYRFEEHDRAINGLAFSDDEKILASFSENDGIMILWDMSNGCIIVSSNKLPPSTSCLAFGGFVRDLKRRDTSHYQLCTAGAEGILIWDIDPFQGDLSCFKLIGDVRATVNRHVTSLAFSSDKETLYGTTTSGDYLIASLKSQRITKVVSATRMSIDTLLITDDGKVILGCGDKTIKIYGPNCDFLKETKLDGGIIGLSMSPDKLEAIALTGFGSVARVNLASLQYILISESHCGPILKVAFDQGQQDRFATISMDGTIKVWDLEEYAVICTAYARKEQERGSYPLSLAFANLLFSGWSDGK